MKLLIVEDEPDIALAIQAQLRANKYVVDWVVDGEEAWDCLQLPGSYDLIILDWMIPGISGLELCRKIRVQEHRIPIIMLTARDQIADRVAGLDAGADDYLVKPFGMEELLARIRALLRRPDQLKSPVLTVAGLSLNYQKFTLSGDSNIEEALTAKEFQLLEYFMEHPNQILSQDQIKLRLWDFADESVSNVVAAQIRLLRRKLTSCGFPSLIETVRGLGYRFNASTTKAIDR
jgi:DNA-binding response OmpR family regulator